MDIHICITLHEALNNGHEDCLKSLLDNGATPAVDQIFEIFRRGNRDLIERLVNLNFDINIREPRGRTLLWPALQNRDFDLAELLIDRGLDINSKDQNGIDILYAVINLRTKDKETMRFLLRHGANPNNMEGAIDTPLHNAINWSAFKLIKLLLDYGADPNIIDSRGRTARDFASGFISDPNLEMVKLLDSYDTSHLKQPEYD
jgi:ankyrin repeat protein